MGSFFFPTRAMYWSFWANVLFIIGMIGYVIMDTQDCIRPNGLNASQSSIIYVILAGIFVGNAALQLLSINDTSRSAYRYYFSFFSYLFDQFGSVSYFLAAVLTAIAYGNSNTIWTLSTIGIFGFAFGAIINMAVRGTSLLYPWANILNLIGSLLYVLAIFISTPSLAQYIVIFGDFVYLIDSILYMICWFSDRQLITVHSEHIQFVQK